MFLFDFLQDEHARIANLPNTEEPCAAYCEHYKQLSPKDEAIAGYMLCTAGKQYVEGYGNDMEIIRTAVCPVRIGCFGPHLSGRKVSDTYGRAGAAVPGIFHGQWML